MWVWIDDDLKYDEQTPQSESWTRSVGSYNFLANIQASRIALDFSSFTFDMGEVDTYPHAPTTCILLLRKMLVRVSYMGMDTFATLPLSVILELVLNALRLVGLYRRNERTPEQKGFIALHIIRGLIHECLSALALFSLRCCHAIFRDQ